MTSGDRSRTGMGLGLAVVICCGGKALLLAALAGGSLGAFAGWAGALAGAALLVALAGWYVRRKSLSSARSGTPCSVTPVDSRRRISDRGAPAR